MTAHSLQLQYALQKPYDRLLFAREVLKPVFNSSFSLYNDLLPVKYQPNATESRVIDTVGIYGKIELEDSTEVTCYEILLQPNVIIDRSKVAIQNYVRTMLGTGQAALINFIAPLNKKVWRLTLIAKDSILTENGIKEKTTNAKRYTFLLGPSEKCRTAAERFEVLSTSTTLNFDALINAFSVEKLGKEFFKEYKEHYEKIVKSLTVSHFKTTVFQGDEKAIRDFIKKLMGRIIFLYFVQKKGWLGASTTEYNDGNPDFMMHLFKSSGGGQDFYPVWLTKLFFETLNRERPGNDFMMPDGSSVKIPFLNGGLFEKEAIDLEMDKHLLSLESRLFHNPNNDDDTNERGFLDFLNSYNFTIYEDSPDDHTVAVDPEMLGHIFENLLEDNKDKGIFYTPKEIVHYMCQESLIEYLVTHLSKTYTVYKPLDTDQIEIFGNEVRQGQLKLIEELGDKALNRDDIEHIVKDKKIDKLTDKQLSHLEQLLDTVKICDPAIGSGAFPMGLLQEIYSIKELIAFRTYQEWNPAQVKLNIIQNSIYGVDIEKGAVDIARLRFWLSLVVDEQLPKPLPNLDYKIVVGDSLVSKFEDEIIEIDWERKSGTESSDKFVQNIQRLLKEVTEKQQLFFQPDNKNKHKLKAEIRHLKLEIIINQLEFNKQKYMKNDVSGFFDSGLGLSKKEIEQNAIRKAEITRYNKLISKLKILQKNEKDPFNHFDWKLDFPTLLNPYLVPYKQNRGFDIVIANPPYVDSETMTNLDPEYRSYIKTKFQFAQGNWDLFVVFIEHGLNILKEKGQFIYIVPNKLISAKYSESLRNYFLLNNVIEFRDYSRLKIFKEANVYPITVFINKNSLKNNYVRMTVMESSSNIKYLNNIESNIFYEDIFWDKYFFSNDIVTIILKLLKYSNLSMSYKNISGAATVSEAYVIKNKLKDSPELRETKKFINTGTIDKWKSLWGLKDTQYIKDKYTFPVIKDIDLKKISNTRYQQAQSNKIIIAGMSIEIEAFLDEKAEYLAGKSTTIIIDNISKLRILVCFLNSKVISFFVSKNFHSLKMSGEYLNISSEIINSLPIIETNNDINTILEIFASYLIYINSKELYEKFIPVYLEQIINGIVYELYFPELLKKNNREIIKHLGELPEINDKMSDEQKMNIIKKVFNRLNDKDHPVKVNLELMKTIPEIRIIEGLEEE